MTYYHIRLFYYAEKNPPIVIHIDQVNLQETTLIKGIIEPYLSKKQFWFGSKKIMYSDVADFKIISTPKAILPYTVDIHGEFVLGTDVSDEVLQRSNVEGSHTNLEQSLLMPKEVYQRLPRHVQNLIDGIRLNYAKNFPDFCFMGIRKTLAVAIKIRFKMNKQEDSLYDKNGRPYSLNKWIECAKQKRILSSSIATKLEKELKLFGDIGAHDYEIDFSKEEVKTTFKLLRLALDKIFHAD